MPDRYWVGGTGTWDGTAGTKWSATSGGPGGASVPTTADDVFFDAGSNTGAAITVTIGAGNTGARSINCTGFTRTIAGSAAITVAGNVTLAAAMTWSYTGNITFTGTATLISAGKVFRNIIVDGAGITFTLGDALTNSPFGSITVTQGTFNTGNFACSTAALNSAGSLTRSINFGSSTVSISGNIDWSGTNLSFNAGTSQLNMSAVNSWLRNITGTSYTFNNVSFTGGGAGATRAISGQNTFSNLTVAGGTQLAAALRLDDNITITGTFTSTTASRNNRIFIFSNTLGTQRTITAATISCNNTDFRDINIAGAASPISPVGAGDCGGNSNITFPAPKTVWRVSTTLGWGGPSTWALSSGGTGNDNNFPLPQDTAIIDNNTTATSIDVSRYNMGTLDCSSRTTAITLHHSLAINRYGSYTLGSGVTVTGTGQCSPVGRGTQTYTTAGKALTFALNIDCVGGGSVVLGDAMNITNSGGIALTNGTFNTNNFNLTTTVFLSSTNVTRTITFGSSLVSLTGTGTVWSFANTTGLTFNRGTSEIVLTNTSTSARTFASGPLSYGKLTIGGTTGTSDLSFTGSGNVFTEIASTKTVAHGIIISQDITADTWSVSGIDASNRVTFRSQFAGTRRSLNLTNRTQNINFMTVQNIAVPIADRFYVGINSLNNGNNRNVYFSRSGENASFLPIFL